MDLHTNNQHIIINLMKKNYFTPPQVKIVAVRARRVLLLSDISAGEVGYNEYGRDVDEEDDNYVPYSIF